MIGKFLVVSERFNTFQSKQGKRIEQNILALLDQEKACPFINLVDFVLTEDEDS